MLKTLILACIILFVAAVPRPAPAETSRTADTPEGWKPYGESVAGPEKVTSGAQAAMRRSADAEIESERTLEAAKPARKKWSYDYYAVYRDPYDYPYYPGFYGWRYILNTPRIKSWIRHYFPRYGSPDVVYVHQNEKY